MNGEKKKLFIIAGVIIGIVILITIILLIYHGLTHKNITYKEIEEKVLVATKKYYNTNKNLLPKNNGDSVTINDTTLTAANYLKSMSELTNELGVTCSAKVVVTNNNDKYRYTPLLDCKDKYKTNTLINYIKDNTSTVTSGQGLYQLNGELVYRGENPNNFIRFSGNNYRIVKITKDSIVLIYNDKGERTVWDDRYNTDRSINDGINDYTVSRIKDSLNSLKIVSNNNKELLKLHSLYIGKRAENDIYNDGTIEKSVTYDKQYYGLLPLYDYLNASIDTNCMSAKTESCTNYNYLNHYNYNWWSLTADSTNTFKVYRINDLGVVETIKAATNAYLRPVIELVADTLYVSGNGTSENPYTVK